MVVCSEITLLLNKIYTEMSISDAITFRLRSNWVSERSYRNVIMVIPRMEMWYEVKRLYRAVNALQLPMTWAPRPAWSSGPVDAHVVLDDFTSVSSQLTVTLKTSTSTVLVKVEWQVKVFMLLLLFSFICYGIASVEGQDDYMMAQLTGNLLILLQGYFTLLLITTTI